LTERDDIRVVKVGGSLLELPDLADRIGGWLAEQSAARTLIVVGGGAVVNAIRHLDDQHPADECQMHWLAIRAMGITARIVSELLPECLLLERWEEIATIAGDRPAVMDVEQFLRSVEPALEGRKLPQSWHVTSDSIAARLACCTMASELVLIKSASPPHPDSVDQWADSGYVDRFFSELAPDVAFIRCVNLRS